MKRWSKFILVAVISLALGLLVGATAFAASPGSFSIVGDLLTYTGKTLFVGSGTDYVAGNGFNFVFDSTNTLFNQIDNEKFIIRNADTTDGNMVPICLQSNSPDTGGRFDGVCLVAIFDKHSGAAYPTRLGIYARAPANNGGGLRKIMDLRWDAQQGGAALGLGVEPIRQGVNLPWQLPIAWIDYAGNRMASWKFAAKDTLQIGDGHNGGGRFTIWAPGISGGMDNVAGSDLVLAGGDSSGNGRGGSIFFAVANPGLSGQAPNLRIDRLQLTGETNASLRPLNGPVSLGDTTHQWASVYVVGDVYHQGDVEGLYAQLQDALSRIRVLEAKP